MPNYKTEKEMLFTFLQYYVNYDKTWSEVSDDMSWDLGDWTFNTVSRAEIYRLAKQMHDVIHPIHEKLKVLAT